MIKKVQKTREFFLSLPVSITFFVIAFILLFLFFPVRTHTDVLIKPYEDTVVHKTEVETRAYSLAGLSIKLDDDWYEYKYAYCKDLAVINTSFLFIDNKQIFDLVPVVKVTAAYNHVIYPGDRYSRRHIHCYKVYADGKRERFGGFCVKNEPERFGKEKYGLFIASGKGIAVAEVSPVKIIDVEAKYQKVLHQYDELKVDNITVRYDDGKSKTIAGNDLTFVTEKEKATENLGENKVEVKNLGVVYAFDVVTIENTNVSNALRDYADEIKEADFLHQTDTCLIMIKKVVDDLGTYYLSHVIINSPSQITGQLSHNDWGGSRERPSDAAERLGLVLATNASYFSYETNNPSTCDVIIKNKKVYSDGETCGKEVCLLKDGTLYSPGEGLTADDLLEMDVVTTWAAGDPLLIQHGELLSTQHDWVNGKYPRTAIGMIKPCDYYILTAGSGGYKGGLTFDDVQAIYNDLGCEYARTFDGGGSSTLAFDTGDGIEVLNRPAGGSERPVADIFGISD